MHEKIVRMIYFSSDQTPEKTTTCLLLVGMTFLFFRFLLTMINNLSIRTKEKSAISVQFKSKIQIQQKYRIFKSSKTKKERVYNMAYHCCWLLVKRVRLDIYLSNAHRVEKGQKIFSHLIAWFIWNAKVSGTYFSIAIVLLLLKLALQKNLNKEDLSFASICKFWLHRECILRILG